MDKVKTTIENLVQMIDLMRLDKEEYSKLCRLMIMYFTARLENDRAREDTA